MTTLAGGFYLGARTPGADALLLDGVHCALYNDFESCVRQVHHYSSDREARERIRDNGERFVRENHTFDQRVPHLLSGEPFSAAALLGAAAAV